MTSYVPQGLRREVETRANYLCEYCLIHEDDTFLGCQVDHVIAEKHGGLTQSNNLCYACTFCNQAKGSDLGSLSPSTGTLTRFFHPREDSWNDHFSIEGVVITPKTPIGEVTTNILGINVPERLLERETLQQIGRFPSPEALQHLAQGDE